jgi:predicted  nucleic acid-binding Zn-ribbon protein
MQSKEYKERFIVMENEITHIKKDVQELKIATENNFQEIKSLLETHIKWESGKYESLQEHYAGKWVEKVIMGIIGAAGAAIVIAAMSFV